MNFSTLPYTLDQLIFFSGLVPCAFNYNTWEAEVEKDRDTEARFSYTAKFWVGLNYTVRTYVKRQKG